jgi:bifunctional non-homologous end joining protein LigD
MIDAVDRPMTSDPLPGGRTGECFFQTHDKGTFGPHVKQIPIEEKDGHTEDYLYFDDIRGLLASVQMERWNSTAGAAGSTTVECPDRWCSYSTLTRGSTSAR